MSTPRHGGRRGSWWLGTRPGTFFARLAHGGDTSLNPIEDLSTRDWGSAGPFPDATVSSPGATLRI